MKPVYQALISMTAFQTVVVMGSLTLPIFAPVAAADLGVDAAWIGYYASVIYLVAMLASPLTAAFVQRYGALRVGQGALLLTALGLMSVPAASLAGMALSAVLIGIANATPNPAGSHLLARFTPPQLRGLVFSVKQTSHTLGGAVAGIAVPALVGLAGWQWTAVAMALICLVLAMAVQPWRDTLDSDRDHAIRLRRIGLAAPIRVVLRLPALRELAAVGMGFAALQLCLAAVLVAYLTDAAGLSLVAAGSALSAMLGTGIGGRLLWGWVADRVAPRTVLAGLALGMTAATFLLWMVSADWPYAAVLAVSALVGVTAMSWNGVYQAAVARHAPEGRVSDAAGGVMFFVYFGALVAPGGFSALATLTGAYGAGFLLLGGMALAPGLLLLRRMPVADEG